MEVDATEPVRWRLAVAGRVEEPLLQLATLITDSLKEEDLEEVDIREALLDRVAAVMWKRSCSERGDGPGIGGRGSDGGSEGGGFCKDGMFCGMKDGGTGNSLRRTGTEDKVMVRKRERGECMRCGFLGGTKGKT